MSYKIEITAGTMNELAGKLLAMAATMQAIPSDPVMPEVKEATKPTRKAKAAPVKEETGNVEAGNTSKSAPDAEPTEDPQTTQEPSSTPADVEPEAKPLDFDKDVAPVVLQAVKQRGKEWVQDILSQFGVERASQVADDRVGELVAILKDGLE